jgi:hypothetical protein
MSVGGVVSSNRVWPNVAIAAQLPNVAAATIQSAKLQVGDLAIVTGGGLYLCTTATLGAAVWQPYGNVLWRWNGADTAQFGAPIDLGFGAGIAGLTIGTVAGGPNGTLLRLASTELVGGAVLFPITFAFPRRYVIEIMFRELAFTDVATQGQNFVGTTIVSDATGANTISLIHFNTTAALPDQYIGDIAASAGVPFGPSLFYNRIGAGEYTSGGFGGPACGMSQRYTINTARPCPAQPEISVVIEGSGDALAGAVQTSNRSTGNSFATPAYPAAWTGIVLNTIGLVVGNGGVTIGWTADIESMQVSLHPDDCALV